MRFHIIRNARIENVGKSQSCMVSKAPIACKQTVPSRTGDRAAAASRARYGTTAAAPGLTHGGFARRHGGLWAAVLPHAEVSPSICPRSHAETDFAHAQRSALPPALYSTVGFHIIRNLDNMHD